MPRRNCEAPSSENTPPEVKVKCGGILEIKRFLSSAKGEKERSALLALGAWVCFLSIYSQCRLTPDNHSIARALKVLPPRCRSASTIVFTFSALLLCIAASIGIADFPVNILHRRMERREGAALDRYDGRSPFVIHLDISSSSSPFPPLNL